MILINGDLKIDIKIKINLNLIIICRARAYAYLYYDLSCAELLNYFCSRALPYEFELDRVQRSLSYLCCS